MESLLFIIIIGIYLIGLIVQFFLGLKSETKKWWIMQSYSIVLGAFIGFLAAMLPTSKNAPAEIGLGIQVGMISPFVMLLAYGIGRVFKKRK